MPSIFQQIKNFIKALYIHVKTGMNKVSGRVFMKRLDICNVCPHKRGERCGKCGCLLIPKAKWKTSTCPIHKWQFLPIMKKILLNTGKKVVKNVIEPIYIESSFIQVYAGVQEILSNINSLCAVQLLYWSIERMNKYNTFNFTKSEKKIFILDMRGKYSVSGVNKALAVLIKNNLIKSTNELISDGDKTIKTRISMYYVNPHYFWKNPIKNSRVEMIKNLELDKKLLK